LIRENAADNSSIEYGEIFLVRRNFFHQNLSEINSKGKQLRSNDGKTPCGCFRTKAQGIYKTKLARDIVKRHGSRREQLNMLWAARV